MGWWPYFREYNPPGGLPLPDDQRPWWALDYGNYGSYIIKAQSSARRTFGVVSYWHDDPGKNAGAAVGWAPLSGTRSAWCGMRQHGDLTVKDPVTGNYYSEDAVSISGDNGTAGGGGIKLFPGYLDQ